MRSGGGLECARDAAQSMAMFGPAWRKRGGWRVPEGLGSRCGSSFR
jgi:hypothetical protein